MYRGKKILALITARGGSKGLPRKNILPLGNKPLIAWTIEAAKASPYVDRLVLSTDDSEIAQVAESFGCEVPFIRPDYLATDTATSMDVILHALDTLNADSEYDYLLLLQPTSPFRTTSSINAAIEQCIDGGNEGVVSVCKAKKAPEHVFFQGNDGAFLPVIGAFTGISRRQDFKQAYEFNGAIYFTRIEFIRTEKTYNSANLRMFIMDEWESLDIDAAEDLEYAEFRLERLKK